MRTRTKVWLGVGFAVTLVVGFAGGIAVGAVALWHQSRQAWVNGWINNMSLLVDGHNAKLASPELVVGMLKSNVDTGSHTLALLYGRLTPYQRSSLAWWAKGAQAVAASQNPRGFLQDPAMLRGFADCLEAARGDSDTFDRCATARGLLTGAQGKAQPKAAAMPHTR